jgi:hypothetical protein
VGASQPEAGALGGAEALGEAFAVLAGAHGDHVAVLADVGVGDRDPGALDRLKPVGEEACVAEQVVGVVDTLEIASDQAFHRCPRRDSNARPADWRSRSIVRLVPDAPTCTDITPEVTVIH